LVRLRGYHWFPDGERLLLVDRNAAWECRASDGVTRALIRGLDDRIAPCFAPSGTQLAFIRENNLWVYDLESGDERQLTDDGSDTVLNGVLDWVYWEELGNRKSWRAFEWSPDGTLIGYLRLDQSVVPVYPLVDKMARHPTVTWQRYPKAGDPNSTPRVRIVEVSSGRLLAEHQEPDDSAYLAPGLAWTPDSEALAFSRLQRDQRSLELRLLDVGGEDRILLSESDPHWLNKIGPPVFLNSGGFLWVSEHTGRSHVYQHAASGEALHAVTSGDWQVEALLGVAERQVYLTGSGIDARERHLYRARMDGTGLERLTSEGGVHQTSLRKDGAWAVVTGQTLTTPPVSELFNVRSGDLTIVRQANASLAQFDWPEVRLVDIDAEDGTRLHGRMLLPPDFDPARQYPVVVHVYGGPHAQTVLKHWAGSDALEQILTRAGIICWRLDNRGSWGRGHAFETPLDRRLGEVELRDQLAGVEYLRSLPFVDPRRIGITGWSYGGYLTLYAMTHAPDVWRCGIAGAPVTDWALYDSIYTERYMGTPEQNPEGYRASSPVNAVEHLAAPLLLVHGTDDDNVHLQHTVQLVEALSRHRKPYELLLQPKQTHGFKGQDTEIYLHQRILEFFLRRLRHEPSTFQG